jgi:MoaA/NifB/PqqE/SkfB family radical SAM enzyme
MWGEHGFCVDDGAGEETLSPEAVVEFLRGAAELRPRTVTISGGEPLLSESCLPLARSLREIGLKVMLTTNATLLADVAPADLAWFRQINVSIDGPPLVLERMNRGGSATMDRALEGLAQVRRIDGTPPALQLLTVITGEGVGHLIDMLDLFEREGVAFSRYLFQHQMFLSPEAAAAHHAALERLLGPGVDIWSAMVSGVGSVDVDVLIDEMNAIRRKIPGALFSPDLDEQELRRYYAEGSWLPPRLSQFCPSPWLDVGIAPDGAVWLCPGFPVGNLHEGTFEDAFNGPQARRLRRTIAQQGLFPGCRGCFYLYNYQAP